MDARRSSQTSRTGCFSDAMTGRFSFLIFVLIIVAHDVIFSSSSLNYGYERHLAERSELDYLSISSAGITTPATNTDQPQNKPHWMMAVECSAYSLDCFSQGQAQNRYRQYPFSATELSLMTNGVPVQNIVDDDGHLPSEWIELLANHTITNYSDDWTTLQDDHVNVKHQHNLYPSSVSQVEYQKCIDFTGVLTDDSTRGTLLQLEELLSSKSLTPEPETNMVAFTISDYSYTQDMLHDMYQMMEHVVGFSQKHFFMVAIDKKTVEMACRHGYPILFWKESKKESLRDSVANTKLVLSMELLKRDIDFFFTEMDVWWLQSPKPSLTAFQRIQDNELSQNHLYFSGHQNNPWAANIGVYAAKANNRTREYFQVCLDVLEQRPQTHDQWAMQQVGNLFKDTLNNRSFQFGGKWGDSGPPPIPTVKLPFHARFWSPHEMVADERPTPTRETLSIHTLCNTPLLNPHGKKMMAREIGAYYGFQTESGPYTANGRHQHDIPAAGYYHRNGEPYRRYLALDGPIRTSLYSMVPSNQYHSKSSFQWVATVLFAIARWTDRILILPQVFNADMDAGSFFAWNIMDYSKVSDFVDTRECNFLSNSKSWRHKEDSDDWPFATVATTALVVEAESSNATIYSHVASREQIVSQQAFSVTGLPDYAQLDAYVAFLQATSEIDAAELLLVNPGVLHKSHMAVRLQRYQNSNHQNMNVGYFEREAIEIYGLLGWCWDEAFRHTVSKTSASHSCFGRGARAT